ncbi:MULTISPECIES: type II toxin-antitoxin system HipA family toxin [unclassified Variovorax]|uniref:type II toxin-antitoxin system HipA family toxin n=1 Tax=unclassified Variovorax TaxID=663243 RepID=UPI002576058D|nr:MULTISPECIES: type II toxin-antitoxin system HipA family toxin [unclassified Variovorax]MDM0089103.1 type II toxin-antitoxin system HipA family toxin [Variovorax sp. J22G40]MDM0147176.1 type II toxin-antitoxin system HipA family toxin [Variovorax sp. J2P1-31]
MNVKILEIALGGRPFGQLFQYADLCRFVADPALIAAPPAEVLSLSMVAADASAQSALWSDVKNPLFNAQGGKLPPYFQNLLPEGVLRTHIAQLRGCREDDHFELLAACGGDLPGAVSARPTTVDRATLQRLITQDQDALEMSVVELPLPQGISVSGVQPKLGLRRQGGRYVARTRAGKSTRVIAKLPVAGRPHMPQLEMLSLEMARAAGVEVCHAELAPLAAIQAEHSYALPDEPDFLAVTRFDRDGAKRIHFEDFAQVLAIDPQHKYGASYLDMALAMQAFPSLGEDAVLELLRRLVVNDLLGNPDAHLKNFGLLYPDGRTPRFAPAYDIVAYAAMQGVEGHGLPLMPAAPNARTPAARSALFTPTRMRAFCFAAGLHEPRVRRAIADTARAARAAWPAMIETATLPAPWKARLAARLRDHGLLQGLARRGT